MVLMSVLAAKVEHLFGVLLRDLRAPARKKVPMQTTVFLVFLLHVGSFK